MCRSLRRSIFWTIAFAGMDVQETCGKSVAMGTPIARNAIEHWPWECKLAKECRKSDESQTMGVTDLVIDVQN